MELTRLLSPKLLVHPSRWGLWIGLVTLVLASPVWAATAVVIGTDASKTVIKGTLVTPDQVIEGELVVDGDTRLPVSP